MAQTNCRYRAGICIFCMVCLGRIVLGDDRFFTMSVVL
jgi:hypothetical protein